MSMILGRAAMAALAMATLLFAAAGMGQSGTVDSDLTGTAWLAEDIGDRSIVDRVQSTLKFIEPGQVGGLAACNRYFGPVALEGGSVAFGILASTRKMCPEASMGQEQRFLQALSAARRLELTHEGQILTMYSDDGAPVLRFSRIIEK